MHEHDSLYITEPCNLYCKTLRVSVYIICITESVINIHICTAFDLWTLPGKSRSPVFRCQF